MNIPKWFFDIEYLINSIIELWNNIIKFYNNDPVICIFAFICFSLFILFIIGLNMIRFSGDTGPR